MTMLKVWRGNDFGEEALSCQLSVLSYFSLSPSEIVGIQVGADS